MDVLVTVGRDEQKVEGGCERICSAACGVVSSGREDVAIGVSSAGPVLGQRETGSSPDAVSLASSSVGDDAAADEVCTMPAEADEFDAHDSETGDFAVEGEGIDDARTEVMGEADPAASSTDDWGDEGDPP